MPLDVEPGPEDHVDPQRQRLRGERLRDLGDQASSQLLARVTAVGKQVDFSLARVPRLSPAAGWKRNPCGPSLSTQEPIPASGTGRVRQKSAPWESRSIEGRRNLPGTRSSRPSPLHRAHREARDEALEHEVEGDAIATATRIPAACNDCQKKTSPRMSCVGTPMLIVLLADGEMKASA